MRLAWKEIIHNKKKYFFIELTLVLMIFMVVFLSGLANGLARAVSAAIENTDATGFVLSDDAEDMLSMSQIGAEDMDKLISDNSSKVTALNIQRATIQQNSDADKLDIMYFAIDPESFLNPEVSSGVTLKDAVADQNTDSIVLDESFQEDGWKVGDTILDSTSGITLTIAGFTKDAMYGHVAAGYISQDTLLELKLEDNPDYQAYYNGAAVKGSGDSLTLPEGLVYLTKADVVSNIPGYSAEQTTIRMILWVLVIISGGVLGVFFYIITLEKLKQFGVMKAIGMGMGEIAVMITCQIGILALIGAAFGNLVAYVMASFLPASMPFYVKASDVTAVSAAFVAVTIFCGLLSAVRVAKVDPLITIGGKE